MTIQQINTTTVEIHISDDEMRDFNVDFTRINNNPETRGMLAALMEEIDGETTIKTANENFFIEAFPQDDDGCILFISAIPENGIENLARLYSMVDVPKYDDNFSGKERGRTLKNFGHFSRCAKDFYEDELEIEIGKNVLIFLTVRIEDGKPLKTACLGLRYHFDEYIRASRLYRLGFEKRLCLEVYEYAEAEICNFLIEYGEILGDDAITSAYTEEYFDCIIESDAVSRIIENDSF